MSVVYSILYVSVYTVCVYVMEKGADGGDNHFVRMCVFERETSVCGSTCMQSSTHNIRASLSVSTKKPIYLSNTTHEPPKLLFHFNSAPPYTCPCIYSGSDVKRVSESQILNAHGLGRGYSRLTSNESWHMHIYTAGTILYVSNCKGWAEKSVIECLWWDKDAANGLRRCRPSLCLKFLLHLTPKVVFLFSVMGRSSVSNIWTETLSNSHLHRIVVSERQWDESTTLVITHTRRESWRLPTAALCFFLRGKSSEWHARALQACKMLNKMRGTWLQVHRKNQK